MVMITPLFLLAIPSVIAGYGFFQHHFFTGVGSLEEPEHLPHIVEFIVLGAFVLGLALAFLL